MTLLGRIADRWLVSAAVVTLLCGLAYATSQQVLRQSANDPQIQMAEDAAAALAAGQAAEAVVPSGKVQIDRSLAPFMIVFDGSGRPTTSSAVLDGQTPMVPEGVIEFVRQHGENRITWAPKPDVRIAAVIVGYGGSAPNAAFTGFVLAGRSLREVEVREDQIFHMAGLGWLVCMGATLVAAAMAVGIGRIAGA